MRTETGIQSKRTFNPVKNGQCEHQGQSEKVVRMYKS